MFDQDGNHIPMYLMWAKRLSIWEQFLLFLGGLGFLYFIHDSYHWDLLPDFSLFDAIKADEIILSEDNLQMVTISTWGWSGGLGSYIAISAYNFWISNS